MAAEKKYVVLKAHMRGFTRGDVVSGAQLAWEGAEASEVRELTGAMAEEGSIREANSWERKLTFIPAEHVSDEPKDEAPEALTEALTGKPQPVMAPPALTVPEKAEAGAGSGAKGKSGGSSGEASASTASTGESESASASASTSAASEDASKSSKPE